MSRKNARFVGKVEVYSNNVDSSTKRILRSLDQSSGHVSKYWSSRVQSLESCEILC